MFLRKIFFTGLKAILLAGIMLINVQAEEMKQPAPNFTLKSYSGKNLKLSEFRGQVVLINFWASWCGPCRQEMPLLEKLHNKYAGLGFTVMGVNVEENNTEAKSIIKKDKLTFPILFDTENKVSELYKVSAMPSTVIVDRDGNMRYLHQGYKPGDENTYKDWVKKLVKE